MTRQGWKRTQGMRRSKASKYKATQFRWRLSWAITRTLRDRGENPAEFWAKLRWDTDHPVHVPCEEYGNV